MRVLVPGHYYELEHFEDDGHVETIAFIRKEKNERGELVTIENGTTNEEVLLMLIDRMKFLQEKMPCRENALVITKLQEALHWLEHRTKDREERGVEGKHQP